MLNHLFMPVLILFAPSLSFAVGSPPTHLENAVIEVTTQSGEIYNFSANDWAVVKRQMTAPSSTRPSNRNTCPVIKEDLKDYFDRESVSIKDVVKQEAVDIKRVVRTEVGSLKKPEKKPEEVFKKNEFQVKAGFGPTGLNDKLNGDDVEVVLKSDILFGVGYTRRWSQRWSLGGSLYSNKQLALGIGYNW